MLQVHDWNQTADNDTTPPGTYVFTLQKFEFTNVGDDNYCVCNFQATVEQPEEMRGMTVFPSLFIGTKDDPGADKVETWEKSRGAIQLKKLLIAVYGSVANLSGDHNADLQGIMGYPVKATCTTDKNDRSRWGRWFNVSDPNGGPVGLAVEKAHGPVGLPSAPPPRPMVPSGGPQGLPGPSQQPQQYAPVAPVAPQAYVAPQPVAPTAPIPPQQQTLPGNGYDPNQAAQPVAPQPQQAAPMAPPRPMPPPRPVGR